MTNKENDNQSQWTMYEPHSNLKYGVYALRSEYLFTIIKSLFLVCAALAAIAIIARLAPSSRKPVEIETGNFKEIIYTMNVEVPAEEPVPTAAPDNADAGPPPEPSANGPITISDNPDQNESALSFTGATSSETIAGNAGTGNGDSVTEGTGTTTASGSGTAAAEPYMVDKMPEFEGGINALYKFIISKVSYPAEARELNKEGTVHVQFVVGTDGNISEITLLNNAGYGMDEEAIRVISLLPAFKSPGMVKGVPVRVNYKLPIKFRMQ